MVQKSKSRIEVSKQTEYDDEEWTVMSKQTHYCWLLPPLPPPSTCSGVMNLIVGCWRHFCLTDCQRTWFIFRTDGFQTSAVCLDKNRQKQQAQNNAQTRQLIISYSSFFHMTVNCCLGNSRRYCKSRHPCHVTGNVGIFDSKSTRVHLEIRTSVIIRLPVGMFWWLK